MTMPYCSEWQGFGTWSNPCSQCFVSASTVRLLYWPVTVANQNPCGNDSTISPTGPSTTIFEGSVVTSPYAYLSFDTLSAFGTGYVPCGATHTNVLVPVKPDQISSFRGPAAWEGSNDPNNHPPPYPFNYADLNYRTLNNSQSYPLVPKEAYEGQQQCYPGNCSTICKFSGSNTKSTSKTRD